MIWFFGSILGIVLFISISSMVAVRKKRNLGLSQSQTGYGIPLNGEDFHSGWKRPVPKWFWNINF